MHARMLPLVGVSVCSAESLRAARDDKDIVVSHQRRADSLKGLAVQSDTELLCRRGGLMERRAGDIYICCVR